MRKDEFRALVRSTFEEIEALTATKGEEYAASADQLANFRRSAMEAGLTMDQVWLVFFNKHIDAIKSYSKTGRVMSEPIEGRIDDAILYLILFKAIIQERTGIQTQIGSSATGAGGTHPIARG